MKPKRNGTGTQLAGTEMEQKEMEREEELARRIENERDGEG